MNLLLIDDDKEILNVFKLLLTKYGHNVVTIDNLEEASLEVKNNYDFIFVDYYMNDSNSLNLIKEILIFHDKNKVVLTTGLEEESIYKNLTKIGIKNILKKPLTATQIDNFVKVNTI